MWTLCCMSVATVLISFPSQCLERFEVVERGQGTYVVTKPHTPTDEVVCVVHQSLHAYCSSNMHICSRRNM